MPALILGVVGAYAVRGAWLLFASSRGLPDLAPLVRQRPVTAGAIEDTHGDLIVEPGRDYAGAVAYQDLPPVLVRALLSAEDKRFFRHRGVDFQALARVAWKTLPRALRRNGDGEGLDFQQGGSTITQQLVRITFLQDLKSRERSDTLLHHGLAARLLARAIGPGATNKLIRKAEEIRIAMWLERRMKERFGSKQAAKEEILGRYASAVYLGHGRHGFAAAAEYYFGKPLGSFTERDAAEAALLAGLAKSPEAFAPSPGDLEPAIRRRNEVLDLMARNGHLDAATAARLRATRPELAKHAAVKTEAPWVVGAVHRELNALASGENGGSSLRGRVDVRTTVDLSIQRIATEALERALAAYEARHPAARGLVQGAVVVLRNRDAAVLAEVGGRQVQRSRRAAISDFDRATDAARQPGSAMKPFVYLAAFRRGFASLDSTLIDEPVSVAMARGKREKQIANYDGTYKGPMAARQALAESRNAVAVRLADAVGIHNVVNTAHELGLSGRLDEYISTALGASEVRLVDLTNAYRAIASGVVATPHVVESVRTAAGAEIATNRTEARVLSAWDMPLRQIQEGLRGVVRLPGGTAHALGEGFPIPLMGKTGTTNDYRDAWFIGSTYGPEGITAGVWIGFDDNRPLGKRETGARAAMPVVMDVMQNVYAKRLAGDVPLFPELIERGIDDYLAFAATQSDAASLEETGSWTVEEAAPLESAPPDGWRALPADYVPPTPVLGSVAVAAPSPPVQIAPPPVAAQAAPSTTPTPTPTPELGEVAPPPTSTPAPTPPEAATAAATPEAPTAPPAPGIHP